MLINSLVNILLLLSAKHISGHFAPRKRILLGAAVGGIYCAACLLPGFHFLGNTLWRLVVLGIVAVAAFGMAFSSIQPGVIYAMLSLALSGVISTMENNTLPGLLAGGALVLGLSLIGSRQPGKRCVPVRLQYGDQKLRLRALYDTGNTLRDPISGRPVLILSGDLAHQLTGLTRQQLSSPVEAVEAIPGLRLIPYKTVGQSVSFLLALRIPNVQIGNWQGSTLVAFAPENIGSEGTYQALTGGRT